jgi:hypothetical protein
MALCRFLLADRPAPEALRPLAIQLLFGDPLSCYHNPPESLGAPSLLALLLLVVVLVGVPRRVLGAPGL